MSINEYTSVLKKNLFPHQVCPAALPAGDRASGTGRGNEEVKSRVLISNIDGEQHNGKMVWFVLILSFDPLSLCMYLYLYLYWATGDKAIGTGKGGNVLTYLSNQVPGHAHVHHLRPAEDRYEGSWASTCARAPAPEGSRSFLLRSC